MPAKQGPDFWFGWLSTLLLRPITYAVKIVMMKPENIRLRKLALEKTRPLPYVIDHMNYGDFDFRQEASALQKAFSYIYVWSMMLQILVLWPLTEIC